MPTLVAVPSDHPGGLEAAPSAHFGHCDAFTLVEVEGTQIGAVRQAAPPRHVHGGCMVPVHFLADQGVQVVIAGGMGLRPLQGFDEVGIVVLRHEGAATVAEAVGAMIEGRLARFDSQGVCGGH